MNLFEIAEDLYLISLNPNYPGFGSFFGSWVYKGKKTVIIDPGPAATIPELVSALKAIGVNKFDAILLTHIHIDHAGGVGDLISIFPDSPVICHKSGIKHLVDPRRLWEGSLKTLGNIVKVYDRIKPVPKSSLIDAELFNEYGIDPIMTPGHAHHHVSYLIGDYLFVGEAGGIFLKFKGEKKYLRPATPPRFFPETSLKSLEKLIQTPHKLLCYSHFGATNKTPEMLLKHKAQLGLWREIISDILLKNDGSDLINICIEQLLQKDPLISEWPSMEKPIQERETKFMKNSIRGFIGYLKNL